MDDGEEAAITHVPPSMAEESMVVELPEKVANEVPETDQMDAVPGTEDDCLVVNAEIEAGTEVAEAETEVAEAVDEVEAETEVAEPKAEIETEVRAEEAEAEEAEADEVESEEAVKGDGGKRKLGKGTKNKLKAPVKKTIEEDVCFICFDGGELVLCDRRGCPKAYHPSCVNRDEAFFRAKGRWNCGWHLCSNCEKTAHYLCYTCTYSLCKACIKNSVILCVRGNKGFCETCMRTVLLIERNDQGNKETNQVDFDDKSSWEYLFKDYWIELKRKLSLNSDELAQAKNPWKGADVQIDKEESADELYDASNDRGSGSDSPPSKPETRNSKRKKAKKTPKSETKGEASPATVIPFHVGGTSTPVNTNWASKELLDIVTHMRDGDDSFLSQFEVQALLLEYIKRNDLRDPKRKSQIICDMRLENLFGKPRVGHFEMLKLLESHFLIKEDPQADDIQGSVVDNAEATQSEAEGNTDGLIKSGKDKRRKMRKKGDDRGLQSNLHDYAAIDIHNINLIYLRRNLMEELIEDPEKFHEKVVGTFVRIRIPGGGQMQDVYRLVQVLGTSKAAQPYKAGKRTTDIMLEVINLNKTEVIPIDTISNQEFTEDECKRLRQSIKCGLINRMTVGEILDKSMELQAIRVKDWLGTETVRLSHLRDRASDLGHRKELRECVEKLQLLRTPEERTRRLKEIPEVHSDPNMDPNHESEEEDSEKETYSRPRGSGFDRKREPISPRDEVSGFRKNWESSRSTPNKGFSSKGKDSTSPSEITNENLWNQGRESRDRDSQQSKPTPVGTEGANIHSLVRAESYSDRDTSQACPSTEVAQSAVEILSETEKLWHYQDPSGRIQGPFSLVQLRKWSNTGYFPSGLRVWRTTEKQDDSVVLTDLLSGIHQKEPTPTENSYPKDHKTHSPHVSSTAASQKTDQNTGGWASNSSSQPVRENWKTQQEMSSSKGRGPPSIEVPKFPGNGWGPENSGRNDPSNLPSPTPPQSAQSMHPSTMSHPSFSRQSSSLSNSSGQVMQVDHHQQYPSQSAPMSGPHVMQPDNRQPMSSAQPIQMPAHQPVYAQSLGTGNPPGNFVNPVNPQMPGYQWETASQMQQLPPPPPLPANMAWGATPENQTAGNQNLVWMPMPGNPNMGCWGSPAPNMNWVQGQVPQPGAQNATWVPGTTNMNWVPTGQQMPPANANVNWASAGQPQLQAGTNMNWVPVASSGNANMNWVAPAQAPPQPPGTTNMNWGPPVQGPATPGNANPNWVAPSGNQGGDGGRGGGGRGGGGGRHWNRQPSFGNSGRGGGGGGGRRHWNKNM